MIVGDWSGDGHMKSDFVFFRSNLDADAIRAAYLEATSRCGVTFDGTADPDCEILDRYLDGEIRPEAIGRLRRLGVDFDRLDGGEAEDGSWVDIGPKGVAALFLEMARCVRPDLEYEVTSSRPHAAKFAAWEPKRPCLNGFWRDGFNLMIGYGIYD